MDVIGSTEQSQYALRQATRHALTLDRKCLTVDGDIFENLLYWLNCTNIATWKINIYI